ncbi:hypothetical protein [Kordia sp.]|uniref:hypothetical protein n=1 Tax=Kordia sp. TaxID=1965332 RepID=UPI003D26CB70
MSNNIQTIKIDGTGTASVTVTGVTNATYTQYVALKVNSDSQEFSGTGEGAALKQRYSSNQVQLPATLEFTFTYSKDGGTTRNPAKRSQQIKSYDQPPAEIYTVTSEDSNDGDDNDTVMTATIHKH